MTSPRRIAVAPLLAEVGRRRKVGVPPAAALAPAELDEALQGEALAPRQHQGVQVDLGDVAAGSAGQVQPPVLPDHVADGPDLAHGPIVAGAGAAGKGAWR